MGHAAIRAISLRRPVKCVNAFAQMMVLVLRRAVRSGRRTSGERIGVGTRHRRQPDEIVSGHDEREGKTDAEARRIGAPC